MQFVRSITFRISISKFMKYLCNYFVIPTKSLT